MIFSDEDLAKSVWTLLANAGVSAALPFLLFVVFVGIYQWRTSRDGRPWVQNFSRLAILIFGVSVLGACAGFSGGMSRTSVVGDVIPAMFTLLGGLSVYLFGIDTSKGVVASITASCLALSLFLAYTIAAQLRYTTDEYSDLRASCMKVYTDPENLKTIAAIQVFEKELGFRNVCKRVMKWQLPS